MKTITIFGRDSNLVGPECKSAEMNDTVVTCFVLLILIIPYPWAWT